MSLTLYGIALPSCLLLGTARYPSPEILRQAIHASGTGLVTVSLRRQRIGQASGSSPDTGFWRLIRDSGVRVLPNTAGCRSVKEALTTAQMARDVFGTSWIKLEITGGDHLLHPDVFALVEAAALLTQEGFEVFPYTSDDLGVADRLLAAGCRVLMPWGSPIGSGQGLTDMFALTALRAHFPDVPLIIDAGLGLPSHATRAMELGYDGILLNTAIADAGDPVGMARAFALAVEAGVLARAADPMAPRNMAVPSTPTDGLAFVEQNFSEKKF